MPGPQRKVTRSDVFNMMNGRSTDEWTVEELANDLGCSNSTVYNRLRELHSLGKIETRKDGQSRYWWVTNTTQSIET